MVAAENWSASKGAAYVALATRRASDFYLALGYTESAAYFRKLSEPANKQALAPVRTVPPGPVEVDTASHPIRASDLTDASGASIQTRPRNRYRPGGNLTSAKLSKRSHGHDSSKPAI
jgi:hypothetical protein